MLPTIRVWECFIITWLASVINVLCQVSLKVSLFIICQSVTYPLSTMSNFGPGSGKKNCCENCWCCFQDYNLVLIWSLLGWLDLWCPDITVIEIIVVLTRPSRKSATHHMLKFSQNHSHIVLCIVSFIVLHWLVGCLSISPALQLELKHLARWDRISAREWPDWRLVSSQYITFHTEFTTKYVENDCWDH